MKRYESIERKFKNLTGIDKTERGVNKLLDILSQDQTIFWGNDICENESLHYLQYAMRQYDDMICIFSLKDSYSAADVLTPEMVFLVNGCVEKVIFKVITERYANNMCVDSTGIFAEAYIYPEADVVKKLRIKLDENLNKEDEVPILFYK